MTRFFYILIVLLVITGCNDSKSKVSKQKDNKELRIVSLASSISDELVELGLQDNIVGATSYCKIAQDNKKLVIGSAIEVNEEKILLLKPDIVFTTTLTKPSTIQVLKNNGIDIFIYSKASSFEAICNNFSELGKQVNLENKAQDIINKSREKIKALRKSIPNQNSKLKMLFQLGASPIATVIPNTYMNDFITFSECENIFYDLDKYVVSRESVLIRNPDVIFITTMGLVGAEEIGNWNKYKELNAVKNTRIFLIDSNLASSPTVTNFTKTLEKMIKKLYF